MKKTLLTLAMSSALLLTGCQDGGSTVASTTAGKIREQDLYTEMKDRYGQQTLSTMLVEDALSKRYGDQVSKEDIQAGLEKDAEKYGGLENFEKVLEKQGMTLESYEESVRLYLLMEQAVLEFSPISDEELQEAYDNYQTEVTASHILVKDEETAKDIIKQLDEGGDWNALVAEHSTDTGTVKNNGQLKFTPGQNKVVAEFEEATLGLEEGQYTSEPVKTAYGFHIIRLDEKPEKGSFDEEKETVQKLVLEKKMDNTALVQEAIGKALNAENVQIHDQDLQGALQNFIPQTGENSEKDSSDNEESTDESESSDSSAEETSDSSEESTDSSEESSEE